MVTIYSSPKDDDKYVGLVNYRTLLELLLIPAIQDKMNKGKKAQKFMLDFFPDFDRDKIGEFKKLFCDKKTLEWNC